MADLELLSKIGKVQSFEKNQTVFMQNEPGDCMYLVLAGGFGVYVDSFTGFPTRIAKINKPGAFFGEMSVIDGSPRSASIIAEAPSKALVIGKKHLFELLTKSPDVAEGILSLLNSRAESMAEKMSKIGMEVPPLPNNLTALELGDIKMKHTAMVLLAKRIRDFNKKLMIGDADEQLKEVVLKEPVNLLPPGHIRYDKEDANNNKPLLQSKKVVCPYCNSEEDAYIPWLTKLINKETTVEMRTIYKNFDILWYTNIVCPNCNYTDTYHEFTKLYPTGRKAKYIWSHFENTEGFKGFKDPYKFTLDEVLLSYYLSIECLKRTSNDLLRLGRAWLKLYWIYGDNDDVEHKNKAAKEAVQCYSTYLEDMRRRITTDEEMNINILLGELSYSLGDIEAAMEYYKANISRGTHMMNNQFKQSRKRYGELKMENDKN